MRFILGSADLEESRPPSNTWVGSLIRGRPSERKTGFPGGRGNPAPGGLGLKFNVDSALSLQPGLGSPNFRIASPSNDASQCLTISLPLPAYADTQTHTLLVLFLWRTLTNTQSHELDTLPLQTSKTKQSDTMVPILSVWWALWWKDVFSGMFQYFICFSM